MSETPRDSLLNSTFTVLSVGFVLTLAVTTTIVVWPLIGPAGSAPAQAAPKPAYNAGEGIDVPAAWYQEAPHTLVLFAQAACGACQSAAPYLQTLRSHLEGRATLVVATPGAQRDAEVEYAARIGVSDHAVYPAGPGLRVRVTPTLVLVNRKGDILGAWEGVGPEAKQQELTKAIDAALARATAAATQ